MQGGEGFQVVDLSKARAPRAIGLLKIEAANHARLTMDPECSIAEGAIALDSPVLALLRRSLGKPRERDVHVIAVEYSVEQRRGRSLQGTDGLKLLPVGVPLGVHERLAGGSSQLCRCPFRDNAVKTHHGALAHEMKSGCVSLAEACPCRRLVKNLIDDEATNE